jgi:hypothetical protein
VGRPHAGSARSRAGSRRRLLARIAGTPTKPWGFAAMPSSGCARRTRCLLAFVVLAGISLTHLRQASQRICRINCSRCYSPHSDVRRPAPAPGPRNVAGGLRFGEDLRPDAGNQTSEPLIPSAAEAQEARRTVGRQDNAAPPDDYGEPSPYPLRPSAARRPARPDHACSAIRFGIHPTLPLHSCLGPRATRRLSSVGRASHS